MSTSQARFTPTHSGWGKEMGLHARRAKKKRRKGSWEDWNATGMFPDRIFSEPPQTFGCGNGDTEAQASRTSEEEGGAMPRANEAMLSTAACPPVRPGSLQHTVAEGKGSGCMREGERKREERALGKIGIQRAFSQTGFFLVSPTLRT